MASGQPTQARPTFDDGYRKLVERSPLPVWINHEGRIVYINNAGLRLLGASSPEQVIGRPSTDFVHPAYHGNVHERVRMAAEGLLEDYTARDEDFVRLDGSVVPVSVSAAVVPFGNSTAIQVYFSDLTDRKRSEQVLRDSERHLRNILDSLFTFVGVMTVDGTLIEANRAPIEAAGITREQVLGRPFWDTFWWSYSPDVQAQLRQAVELARKGVPSRYDAKVRMKDGQFMTIDFMLNPMRDDSGQVTHLIPSAVDITERAAANDALRRSEERFRATFEQAAVGIAHVGTNGEWLRVNERLCQIVGYTREELYRLTFSDITHPDDLDADWQQSRALLRGDIRTHSMEKRYIRKDGSVVWINLTGALVRDSEGQPDYFISVVEDIDARKQAEIQLRASEDRFRKMFERSLVAKYILDPKTGAITAANERGAQVLECTRDELLGRPFAPFEAGPDSVMQAIAAVMSGETFQFESQWRTTTGGLRDVAVTCESILADGRRLVYVSALDITERRQAEQTLRDFASELEKRVEERTRQLEEQRRFLEAVLDTIDVGVVSCDAEGRLTRFNRAASEWHDQPFAAVPAENWAEHFQLFEADGRSLLAPDRIPLLRALRGEHVRDLEIRVSGGERLVRSSARPMFDDLGNQLGAVVAMHDITQQNLAEEERRAAMARLEEANQELESFAYSVSHDLRAPLRSIEGFAHILLRDYTEKLQPTGSGYLMRIGAAARRMGQLINDILLLSRISRHSFSPMETSLSAVAESVAAGLRERNPERNVEVSVTPGLRASADPSLVRILLENLLSNAWKFTGRTTDARIEFGQRADGPVPVFYVRDNGAGFDMAFADQLFRPFSRLHAAHEFEGTGIGLATVHRVVRHHKGKVWAEAEPGAGATFWFTLQPETDA